MAYHPDRSNSILSFVTTPCMESLKLPESNFCNVSSTASNIVLWNLPVLLIPSTALTTHFVDATAITTTEIENVALAEAPRKNSPVHEKQFHPPSKSAITFEATQGSESLIYPAQKFNEISNSTSGSVRLNQPVLLSTSTMFSSPSSNATITKINKHAVAPEAFRAHSSMCDTEIVTSTDFTTSFTPSGVSRSEKSKSEIAHSNTEISTEVKILSKSLINSTFHRSTISKKVDESTGKELFSLKSVKDVAIKPPKNCFSTKQLFDNQRSESMHANETSSNGYTVLMEHTSKPFVAQFNLFPASLNGSSPKTAEMLNMVAADKMHSLESRKVKSKTSQSNCSSTPSVDICDQKTLELIPTSIDIGMISLDSKDLMAQQGKLFSAETSNDALESSDQLMYLISNNIEPMPATENDFLYKSSINMTSEETIKSEIEVVNGSPVDDSVASDRIKVMHTRLHQQGNDIANADDLLSNIKTENSDLPHYQERPGGETSKSFANSESILNLGELQDSPEGEKADFQKNQSLAELLHPLYKYFVDNKCLLCGFVPKYKSRDKRRHLATHLKTRNFKCNICDKCFKTPSALGSHRTTAHEDFEQVSCEKCGQTFSRKTYLRNHMRRKHNPSEKQSETLICKFCDKEFKYLRYLKDHLRIHTGEKPYECENCDQAFRTKDALKSHSVRHNPEKRYLCSVCSKSYSRRALLKEHMNTHTITSSYKCEDCGKTFNFKSNLCQHRRVHSDTRNYSCEICDMKFKFPHHLRSHVLTHDVK